LPGATHELPGTRRELPGPTLELPCTGDEARVQAARRAVAAVPDPELPALTLADLGIVRFVDVRADGVLDVGLSPTYTGCPATDHIAELVRRALEDAAVGEFAVRHVLAPAWSSDWITVEGRRKLDAYGIVPPEPAAAASSWRSSAAGLRPPACPRCHSASTETISEFGSTPCKALHRCLDCLEPFERFKCL
jgi:ring-1,2-phenylacetyl-CoA epoxidase subunit PaaD